MTINYNYYIYYINNNLKEIKEQEMADYILKGIDDQLWREVKAVAALQGMSIKDLIIKLLEKEAKKLRK